VIGAPVIVIGLYTVLWGKGRDLVVVHTETSADEEMNNAADETATRARNIPQRNKESCSCMCPYMLF
jgi:hypothetical protein